MSSSSRHYAANQGDEVGKRERAIKLRNASEVLLDLLDLREVLDLQEGVVDARIDHDRERMHTGQLGVDPFGIRAQSRLLIQIVEQIVVDAQLRRRDQRGHTERHRRQ